jgi:hypothetical protein
MNPVALLKHAALDASDDQIRNWKTWQLWLALAVLAALDVGIMWLDWIPLLDDMLIGGLAVKVSAELLRRRKEAKEGKDGEEADVAVKEEA